MKVRNIKVRKIREFKCLFAIWIKFEIWKLSSKYKVSKCENSNPTSKYETQVPSSVLVRNMKVEKLKYSSSKYESSKNENLLESSKYESSKVWSYEIIHGLSFVIIFVFTDSVATV